MLRVRKETARNGHTTGERLRILGVFAHPDDEVFCAGGLFAQYADTGAEVSIISATRGQAGQIRNGRVSNRQQLGIIREQEFQQACTCLGVKQSVCLNYEDGKLEQIPIAILGQDIFKHIQAIRPHLVLTFGKDGAYGHPDHIAISRATDYACALAVKSDLPMNLYYSYFPSKPVFFMEELARWLVDQPDHFQGSPQFIQGFLTLVEAFTTLHYASDFVDISWYPPGFTIVEQGENVPKLHLILSGHADIIYYDKQGAAYPFRRLQAGEFFGQENLISPRPEPGDVIAIKPTTCLVFSHNKSTLFAGRGSTATSKSNAQLIISAKKSTKHFAVDIFPYLKQKIEAIAAHQTQFPIEPSILPSGLLSKFLAHEYFLPGRISTSKYNL